jgi:peroxiredoxin Q/BCP
MDAYRDQYAQLFDGRDKVTLVSISVDPDTALASWARDRKYDWTFLSDTGGVVGQRYGSVRRRPDGSLTDNRTLFIVGPDGKIAHVMAPFREVDPVAYTELGDAVKRIAGLK